MKNKFHYIFQRNFYFLLLIYFIVFKKLCFADQFGIYDDYSYDYNYPLSFGAIIFCLMMIFVLSKWLHWYAILTSIGCGIFLVIKGGVGIAIGLPLIIYGLYLCEWGIIFKEYFSGFTSRNFSDKKNNKQNNYVVHNRKLPNESRELQNKNYSPKMKESSAILAPPDPARLIAARLRLRKSQQSVAKILGVTHAAYDRWECGSTTPPPDQIEKLWKLITLAEKLSEVG